MTYIVSTYIRRFIFEHSIIYLLNCKRMTFLLE